VTIHREYRTLIDARMMARPVDVPGFSRESMAVRLLSDEQVSQAKIAAYKHLDAACKEAGTAVHGLTDIDAESFDQERIVQMIHRAFVDAATVTDDIDDPKPALTTSMIRSLDSALVQEMFDTYLAYKDTRQPRPEFDTVTLDEIVDALTEPDSESAIAGLTDSALRRLVLALAAKLRKSA
jgi:hypothetical protein